MASLKCQMLTNFQTEHFADMQTSDLTLEIKQLHSHERHIKSFMASVNLWLYYLRKTDCYLDPLEKEVKDFPHKDHRAKMYTKF